MIFSLFIYLFSNYCLILLGIVLGIEDRIMYKIGIIYFFLEVKIKYLVNKWMGVEEWMS